MAVEFHGQAGELHQHVPDRRVLPAQERVRHIGAEIGGLDLNKPLDDETVARARRKLVKYKVLFFRDEHLGHAQQIEVGRRFGELTHAHPHEDAPPSDAPKILTIAPGLRAAPRLGPAGLSGAAMYITTAAGIPT